MDVQIDLFSLGLINESSDNEKKIKTLINKRRRQVLIHSCIYYRMNTNLVDDKTWNSWAMELENLHHDYPEISKECIFADSFKDFSSATGFDLHLDDPWIIGMAQSLIQYKKGISKEV